jgi:poly-gamma-glutamate capsule biosynthesis protein CapA/YwtB (metallophosphatase superfamily)
MWAWKHLALWLVLGCGDGLTGPIDRHGSTDGPTDGQAGDAPHGGSAPTEDVHEVTFAGADTDELPPSEIAARAAYASTPITLRGRVLAPDGSPVANANVRLGDVATRSAADGRFELKRLRRHNRIVEVEAPGFRKSFLYPQLVAARSQVAVDLPITWLVPSDPEAVRMLFAGDLALARRFLDPDNSTPRGQIPPPDPTALISSDAPEPGSRAAVKYVKALFQEADFSVVNLETPVTDVPAMPHPTKDYCFFMLPGSLVALEELGVDYAGLGNNHLYDYQQPGLADTRRLLDDQGVPYSGAGATPAEAFAPYRTELAGTPYAFVAMNGIIGSQHAIQYVASATQGGAADLRDDATITSTIGGERAAGRAVIAMLHQGREYTFEPSTLSKERMQFVTQRGADLVIGHHPHVAHGFGYTNGVLQVHSLGNFAFDSERLETMWSMVVQLEMKGRQVEDARAIGVYIEDFRPRPMTTLAADRFFRRIAEFSNPFGAFARGDSGGLRVTPIASAWVEEDQLVTIDFEVGTNGVAIIDLRGRVPTGASVRGVKFAGGTVRIGRDILQFGDFEDADVDDDTMELARWNVDSSHAFPCVADPYRGATALCLRNQSSRSSTTVVTLNNRARVMGDADDTPNKDVSVIGYARHQSAGRVVVRADYLPSAGSTVLGSAEVYGALAGQDRNWTRFQRDLNLPDTPTADARAVRLVFRHERPQTGDGMFAVDDVAIINWEQQLDPSGATSIATPHARDFLRVEAAPGVHKIVVSVRTTRRAAGLGER